MRKLVTGALKTFRLFSIGLLLVLCQGSSVRALNRAGFFQPFSPNPSFPMVHSGHHLAGRRCVLRSLPRGTGGRIRRVGSC